MEGNPYDPDWTEDNDLFDDEREPSEDELEAIEKEQEDSEFNENMDELLAHYEEESKEFNEAEAEFIDTYGFEHHCRCAQDWAEGNLGVVSVCYLTMVSDAMETLATTHKELKEAKREIADLRIQLASA